MFDVSALEGSPQESRPKGAVHTLRLVGYASIHTIRDYCSIRRDSDAQDVHVCNMRRSC